MTASITPSANKQNARVDYPFTKPAFLTALEEAGVCSRESGWNPVAISVGQEITLPCYLKTHSWGEYVFDWAWAHAYEQYGMHYYPKLVVGAPYTPAMGPRLLGASTVEDALACIDALEDKTRETNASGFHILFPDATDQALLDQCQLLKRTDVQFHWSNEGYRDFDDFLSRFSSRKRKNVNKERASIGSQGLDLRTIEGKDIQPAELAAFYQFYHATYLKRGRQGYLNKAFFDLLLAKMPEQLMLVIAEKAGQPVAASLFFKDQSTLYGRYWGCFEEYKNLHFEACYYRGIEYCIEQGLSRFDPGTQGEHKIARGFQPVFTHSYHWLKDPAFFEAAARFCEDEAKMTEHYFRDAQAALPFKQESS